MRHRLGLRTNAFTFSATAACCGLLMTFFFYDGPIIPNMAWIGATAEATAPVEVTSQPTTPPARARLTPQDLSLPAHFQPDWYQLSLDQGTVSLYVLRRPVPLSASHQQLGSEAYDYAAFLFEQAAQSMPQTELSHQLNTLSMQAQTMGHALRQAGDLSYDGPPSQDMTHLNVRSAMQYHLEALNPTALITARYNQNGALIDSHPAPRRQPGAVLRAFLSTAEAITSHPAAAQYPQTMALIRQEVHRLNTLSQHVALRWESTHYCKTDCNAVTTHVRLYLKQSAPATVVEQPHPSQLLSAAAGAF